MISINNFGRAGRLGNQIFQFALLFFLNKKKGYQINLPIVDCQFWKCFDLQNINISHHLNNPNRIFHERFGSCNFDELVLQQDDNTTFDGYYQSYMYFDSVKNDLIDCLKFKQHIIDEGNLEYKKYSNKKTVSMHIRRTDYLDHVNVWGDLFVDKFYDEALKTVNDDTENVLIFTDDNDFARKHFNKPNYFIIDKDEYVSLYMMTLCDRHIISNSSFAWWGAYLSGKENIICPKPWWPITHPGQNSVQKNITKPDWAHIKCFDQKGK
jgi:hypothetical protein